MRRIAQVPPHTACDVGQAASAAMCADSTVCTCAARLGRLGREPAVAGGDGYARPPQRPHQVVQQVGWRLDVGIAERVHLCLGGCGPHAGEQVVDLL